MGVTVTSHERALRQLPCCVSDRTPVTLHHCHGGSILDAGFPVGMALKQNPFLQIPLHAEYHVGNFGIDYGEGVLTWEQKFGTQVEHLRWVQEKLGYPVDLFEMARTYAVLDASGMARGAVFE
jgi:hypothetical protein